MALPNAYAQYNNSKVLTASPAELTLMLYDGAIKFCNVAIIAVEQKDIEKANNNILKVERIIDYFRQERSEQVISNDEVEVDLFNNCKLCEGTVEDRIVHHQVLTDVRRLVEHLPENQREVLEMRYYQDLSFKEIAEKTGVSINTALGRMRYAILNLRRMAEEFQIELSLA